MQTPPPPIAVLPDKTSPISIKNNAAVQVYTQILARRLPEEGTESAMAAGLFLNAQYFNLAGNPVDPAGAFPGDDTEVRVTISNRSRLEVKEIAIVHAFPASWEILNTRLTTEEVWFSLQINYQDIRDDMVMAYLDLQRG